MAGSQNIAVDRGTVHVRTPINAVTATTQGAGIPIQGAKKVTWFFTRANHSAGSSAFTVDISCGDGTWVGFNMLVQNLARDAGTGTAGEDIGTTAVTTVTLSSNTTVAYAMDLSLFTAVEMRVKVTETTDGTHTAKCVIEF